MGWLLNMIIKETASMLTRDGVRLDADIYRPEKSGKFPVLLMRQPYSKAIASTVVYAHPTWYAQQGYIVIIQDVRGRGTSEGVFQLFAHELEDGVDTVNWVANLPYSNGAVGMYGFSYQGMTQIYAGSGRPQALKTLCPAMVAPDLYQDWAYEGGAFCWQINLGWGIQLATETARLQGNEPAYIQFSHLARNLPLNGEIPTSPETFTTLAPDSFYHEWLRQDQAGDYWRQLSPQVENLNLPMLHIGGWFDTYLRGTVHFYQDMVNRSPCPQYLIIGPWGHLPWGQQVGGIDYGEAAISPIDELQIRWFDHFLKGIDTGLLAEQPVTLFSMGNNCWREFEGWPEPSSQSYVLTSNGLAAIRSDSGLLLPEDIIADDLNLSMDISEEEEHILPDTVDVFVHDPFRPVPVLGGHSTLNPGSYNRTALDCRGDVLTYTSDALDEDLHLAGDVFVEVYCSADTPSFDLCGILSEVRSDGTVWNFTQGYIRVNQPQTPIRINLQPTCICIPQSHKIRLSLSGACFPAYPVNPGTGQPPSQTRLIDAGIITISVKTGNKFPSRIVLPKG